MNALSSLDFGFLREIYLKRTFINKHLKQIRRKTLNELLQSDIHIQILFEFFPIHSHSRKLLDCLLYCKNILKNHSRNTVNWTEFFTKIPNDKYRLFMFFEYRRFQSTLNSDIWLLRVRHLAYDCLKNLETNYDYIIFQCEIRNKTPQCKRIIGQIYLQNKLDPNVHHF